MALNKPIRPPVWTTRSAEDIARAWSDAARTAVTPTGAGTPDRDRQKFALGVGDALDWAVNEDVRCGDRCLHRLRCVEDVREELDRLRAQYRREPADGRSYIVAFGVVLRWLLGEREDLDYPGHRQHAAA